MLVVEHWWNCKRVFAVVVVIMVSVANSVGAVLPRFKV
jgi:hypothetical protein